VVAGLQRLQYDYHHQHDNHYARPQHHDYAGPVRMCDAGAIDHYNVDHAGADNHHNSAAL
jgi:hypothetical protein